MTTKSEVYDLLSALGGDMSEVAATLREENIKGEKGRSLTCPIAVYLRHRAIYADVMVEDTTLRGLFPVVIDNPSSVAEFVQAFDDNKFPELEF